MLTRFIGAIVAALSLAYGIAIPEGWTAMILGGLGFAFGAALALLGTD